MRPLFFDIYSHDLKIICSLHGNILFADEICLIYVHDALSTLVDHDYLRLCKILDWCRYNKLSLNPTKTELMLVTNRQYSISPCTWWLDSNKIILKLCVKSLGLSVNDNFKFQSHAKNIKSRPYVNGGTLLFSASSNYKTSEQFYCEKVPWFCISKSHA